MTVLGTGTANAGISILHAAGLGKGCSVGINLQCEVRLVEGVSQPTDDHHGLLDSVMQSWIDDFGAWIAGRMSGLGLVCG